MANKDTAKLIEDLVADIVENTEGLISADILRGRLIDILQSRGLFETFQGTKLYYQNEHISFTDDNIYKCIEDLDETGQSPTTHPLKWKVIGALGSITAAIVAYVKHSYTTVEEALDSHEAKLAALIPDPPPGLTGRSLTMVLYTALAAGSGDSHSCTDETQPEASIEDVYNANSGDLSSEIDSVIIDTVPLDANDNTGSYGSIIIVREYDPYEGVLGQGVYSVLEAIIKASSALTVALHTYRLIHSETGITNTLSFYVDDPGTPVVSNVSLQLPANATKYISGVPSLQNGDNIQVDIDVTGAVGSHYNPTRVARIEGDGTNNVDIAPPLTPPANGDTLDLSTLISIQPGAFTENMQITSRGYNSKGDAGSNNVNNSNVYVDDVSDESARLTAGSGLYPATGYGAAYDSTQSIKTVYTNELQHKNGKYQAPSGDYTGNLPTAGENLNDGMGVDDRYCIPLTPFSISNVSGFTIELNDSENFSDAVTSDLTVQVKVEGVTGWLDANAAYSSGSPVNDGDPCQVFFDSDGDSKRVTFGDVLRTGLVYVRVGLPMGDIKKFSGITISNII